MQTSVAVLSCLVTAVALTSQQLVLPDNHHLMASPTQLDNTGSPVWWRSSTVGHFQILYEASHFLGKAGINSGITITKIRFRGEDGEPNLGGQVWNGVEVQCAATTLNTTTMLPHWGYNLWPGFPESTTLGPWLTTNVTVNPSLGSTPNNWCIEIDVGGWWYDPTGPWPNLLIDIVMPNPPSNLPPLAMIPIQDTTPTGAGIRGKGVTSDQIGPFVMSGTYGNPPVLGIEFFGSSPPPVPARTERYGAACGGSPSTFYEHFQNGQAFDLHQGLTLTPDNPIAPNYYVVSPGAPPLVPFLNPFPDTTADNALVTSPLPFTFAYPGGSTNTVKASTNGFVWLDSTMTATSPVPTLAELLGSSGLFTARLMPCWHDFAPARNTATHPFCGLHVYHDLSGGPGNQACYVTWKGVGSNKTVSGPGVGGHADYTFQCVLHESTNVVEFRYGPMPNFFAHPSTNPATLAGVVGFTRGRIGATPSANPQSRDLSFETPFATAPEGFVSNMGQTAVAAPDAGGPVYGGRYFGGQTITYGATNVPAGAVFGVQLLDFIPVRPGIQLPGLTAPGCLVSTTLTPLLWELFLLPAATVTGTIPVTMPHGYEGTVVVAQFVVLDGLVGAPDLVTVSSNAMLHVVGLD